MYFMQTIKMRTKPKILQKNVVATSNLFTIESVLLRFSNSQQCTFERLVSNKASVMVVPVTADQKLLLIREYALGTEQYEITFPKGAIDTGESLLNAANRELQEEIGFGAKSFHDMKQMTNSPAYSPGKMHMLVAWDLYPAQLVGDEPEPIEVLECGLDEIDDFIARDDFTDARSIAAMLLIAKTINNYQ